VENNTRKAYVWLKRFVFLRSLNVKDSKYKTSKYASFIEHPFQQSILKKVIRTPTSGGDRKK
jgi:hypothetical protein